MSYLHLTFYNYEYYNLNDIDCAISLAFFTNKYYNEYVFWRDSLSNYSNALWHPLPFFKEIYNPEYNPKRLESMLSNILKQQVKILHVLPNDSTRLAGETSLVLTDIIVELEDRSIANVEVQKNGYKFPGQRSACYSADMLLRQYKRLRDSENNYFNYKHVKTVYTIVLYEESPSEFKQFPDRYFHHFRQTSNTGLEMNLLQEYFFIPLDIFRKNIHTRDINNELDAWLTFLSTDEPEAILKLIQTYPQFESMYRDIYELCGNIERMMHMFSKELAILDRNTAQLMIDEMQEEVKKNKQELVELNQALQDKKQQLREHEQQLQKQELKLQEQELQLQEQELQLKHLKHQEIINRLYALLASDNRSEDITKAASDEDYRIQLLEEYHII